MSLCSFLKKTNFFKEIGHIKDEELLEISSSVKYLFAKKGQVIFEVGDKGQLFYTVIEGTSDVFVPILQKKSNKSDYYVELSNGLIGKK